MEPILLQARQVVESARETRCRLKIGTSHDAGLVSVLRGSKREFIKTWATAVQGINPLPTLFRKDGDDGLYSAFFDAIMDTLLSCAEPRNAAALWAICDVLIRQTESTEDLVVRTMDAISLFEETAVIIIEKDASSPLVPPQKANSAEGVTSFPRGLSAVTSNSDSSFSQESVGPTIRSVLQLANSCLEATFKRRGATDIQLEVRELLTDAREELLQTLEQARSLVPFIPKSTVRNPAELLDTAQKLQKLATQLAALQTEHTLDDASPATSAAVQAARVALVYFLRQRHSELSKAWMKAITEQVDAYKNGIVSTDINQLLINAMIERLRPNGDSAALVYVCQKLVDMRYESMSIESVQHATRLFEPVAVEMCQKVLSRGTYDPELLPLTQVSDIAVHSMLADVTFQACRLLRREYYLRKAHTSDPRPKAQIFVPEGGVFDKTKVVDNLLESLIAGRYRIRSHITSGAYGHGFLALDQNTNQEIFVKIFKCAEEGRVDPNKITEELEITTRISQVEWLMNHRNIVKVHQVLRDSAITLPRTRTEGQICAIITDYCDGGELFNYLFATENGKRSVVDFTEPQARFLVKQITDMLVHLHCPPPGSEKNREPFFHGDLKLENLVMQNTTTVKLIDYGSLAKASDHPTHKHLTPSYKTEYHDAPLCTDVWALGVIMWYLLGVRESIRHMGTRDQVSYAQMMGRLMQSGMYWRSFEKVMPKDHPFLKTGPDSARDLLDKILGPRARNSINIQEVAAHPWFSGPVATEAEMTEELQRRFKGIRADQAPSFSIGVCTPEEAQRRMRLVVEAACHEAKKARFVISRDEQTDPNYIFIQCNEPPDNPVDTGYFRWDEGEGQWVIAKFRTFLAPLPNGKHAIKLEWLSGSATSDFMELQQLIYQQAQKVEHV
eukprot:TRINITY_DN30927_c0_g1_i1.p1 TRINITY_DN30927_c0_g1~~TRINITY_DN30927_c0_g1_i1.p1  ORF type:complete len:901 (+),score=137.98 TRINITY_DN30927_c0_g1_i1:157-2859(+)